MKEFEQFRNTELKSKYSDFNLDEILKNAANNDYWQNKQALWTILSGACNDAGKQFYIALREYIQNLVDIDTCNIHSLKSIAHSVDADHLVSFIQENYPPQLLKLINLFSIPRSVLLNQLSILHADSIFPKLGALEIRNEYLDPPKYYVDLIYDIKNNISKLKLLLIENKIPLVSSEEQSAKISDLINTFNDLSTESGTHILSLNLETNSLELTDITELELQDLLDIIENIDLYVTLLNTTYLNKTKEFTLHDIITACQSPNFNFTLTYFTDNNIIKTTDNYFNPFYALIHVFKSNLYNSYNNNMLQTSYYDLETNTTINLYSLIMNIIETIQMYDDTYIKEFLTFHFYGLFYDMIINDQLKNEYVWENYTPSFISTIGEYTYDEFKELVKSYITDVELEEFSKNITNFKKIHVDFIQFLSILNYTLEYSKYDENGNLKNLTNTGVRFPYIITYFNNNFDISDVYNEEKRRLLGLNKNGEPEYTNLILKIALNFTDICLQISYARENIKTLIQQYSYIGTKKIITDVIREYFIKNFSKRSDWRLQSDTSLQKEETDELSGIFRSINSLNGIMKDSVESQFFNVELIEYYDNTQYFNIYSDLPSCIVGYTTSGVIPAVSTFISLEDYVSTWTVTGSGILSSINDDLGIIVPSSLLPTMPTTTVTVNGVNNITIEVPTWNASVLSSIFIPAGTIVSSIIPAGNLISITSYVDNLIPITGLCATFVSDWNTQFWKRDFSKETPSSELIKDEILFFENFFPELKMAKTDELRFEIYRNNIYPLLSGMWESFATSGFMSDPLLSALQIEYSGQYPGKYLTKNIANKTFTTIAPFPYIRNLIPENGTFNDTSLYLAKPFYENIAYYINLMTKEILNMQTYNDKTGQGLPTEGWKQSYIEFKGYNTSYEDSKNQANMSLYPSAVIDCDGPWVYSALQDFIKLYYDYPIGNDTYQIPYEKIKEYVDKNYITVGKQIRENIIQQLFAYQHEIYDKQNYRVHDFQFDQYDNQFTLYKHKDFNEYEDAGEIWIRMKNYPLSVPLMKNVKIKDSSEIYTDDIYDTLQCNQHISYANMWKQLCNNAIRFGVIKSTLWILGYTNWIKTNDYFIESDNSYYLKLGCLQYYQDTELNTLVIDTTTCKFFSLLKDQDNLEDINEYIGVYFNQIDKSLEFALYDKTTHRSNIVNNAFTKDKISEQFKDTTIPITIYKYNFSNYLKNSSKNISISNTYYPAFNLSFNNFIYDLTNYKAELKTNNIPFKHLIGEFVSGSFDNFNYYGYINSLSGSLVLNGTLSGQIINPQNEHDISTTYGIVSADLSQYNDSIYTKNTLQNINLYWYNEILNPSSGVVQTNFIIDFPKLSNNNDSGIINMQNNIWRLNSDNTNVNIAYESINVDLISSGIYDNIIDNTTEKTYYIGVLKYICPLLVQKVSDTGADDTELYSTGFYGINVKYDYEPIYINDINDKTNLQLINNKYPKCLINENNELVIETIITTLGGDKTIYTSTISDDVAELLKKTIVTTASAASGAFINVLSSDFSIYNSDVLTDNSNVYISGGLENLINAIKLNPASINPDATWNSNDWGFDFKKLLEKYNESNDLNDLNLYSNSLQAITDICQLTPVLTTCLIEPLKIICNFGTYDNPNYTVIGNEYFDLDIKVYIDDEKERNKAVGWNCGYKSTKYLNWITNDNRYGGPEIVLVDVDTYRTYNLGTLYGTTDNPKLNIFVNVCWFDETQLLTQNVSININWKGYMYKYPIKDVLNNTACCDNLSLKISVDLIKNTIECYPVSYVPIISTVGTLGTNDFNMSIGYIKVIEPDFINDIKNYEIIENKYIKLTGKTSIKNYYLIPSILSMNKNDVINLTLDYLNNNWFINYNDTKISFNTFCSDKIELISEDEIILNNNKVKLNNKLQCFLNNKYFN